METHITHLDAIIIHSHDEHVRIKGSSTAEGSHVAVIPGDEDNEWEDPEEDEEWYYEETWHGERVKEVGGAESPPLVPDGDGIINLCDD